MGGSLAAASKEEASILRHSQLQYLQSLGREGDAAVPHTNVAALCLGSCGVAFWWSTGMAKQLQTGNEIVLLFLFPTSWVLQRGILACYCLACTESRRHTFRCLAPC